MKNIPTSPAGAAHIVMVKCGVAFVILASSTAWAVGQETAPPLAAAPTPALLEDAAVAPVPERQAIWRCEVPGGVAEVAVRSMVSVSSHEYIADGVSRVVEVNIDTQGHMALRYYFIEAQTPAPSGSGQSALERARELAKDLSGRSGFDSTLRGAAKNYPATTHSHTIEYRIESEEQLRRILASASAAFRSGASSTLKAP
ncbi:MAG: hypothetical protein H0V56_03855 [Chthoniobacterales bacterium]|nr:hypothetical protein [Chthoniobacterales bacterium]